MRLSVIGARAPTGRLWWWNVALSCAKDVRLTGPGRAGSMPQRRSTRLAWRRPSGHPTEGECTDGRAERQLFMPYGTDQFR